MNLRTAVKVGLAQFLAKVMVDGEPAFSTILTRSPRAGELEDRPFASLRVRLEREDVDPFEIDDSFDEETSTMLFQTGEASGTVYVYVGTQDQEAGAGDGEVAADAIEDAIEAACDPRLNNEDVDPEGEPETFGIIEEVADYGGSFGYYFIGSEDPPIEESVRGLVDTVLTFRFEGPELKRRVVTRITETQIQGLED